MSWMRKYKTTDRIIRSNLSRHAERMNELVLTGLTKETASALAYAELFGEKKQKAIERGEMIEFVSCEEIFE